jgi:hypothetical protein
MNHRRKRPRPKREHTLNYHSSGEEKKRKQALRLATLQCKLWNEASRIMREDTLPQEVEADSDA